MPTQCLVLLLAGCFFWQGVVGTSTQNCLVLVEVGHECENSKSLNAKNGPWTSPEDCALATKMDTSCSGNLFSYESDGKCLCAMDSCKKTRKVDSSDLKLYFIQHNFLFQCSQKNLKIDQSVCKPSDCTGRYIIKKPVQLHRCKSARCTLSECCEEKLIATTRRTFDASCRPPVESRFKLRWDPPACLYTIPGSGNTFTRLLIDGVLQGYHSQSLYHDQSLASKLPGELSCDRSASVIKIHPATRTPFKVIFGPHAKLAGCKKCVPDPFVAAVIVTRHPMRAFFSNYNLANSNGQHQNRHTNRVKKQNFDAVDFGKKALRNAVQTKIYNTRDLGRKGVLGTLSPSNVVVVKFEDLTSKDISTRRAALRRIVEFLVVKGTVITDSDLDAAFAQAEKMHRHPPDLDDITFEEAFVPALQKQYWQAIGDIELVGGYKPLYNHTKFQRSSDVQSTVTVPTVHHTIETNHDVKPDGVTQKFLQRSREVAPFPLIVVISSRGYVPELINFAESIRRTRGAIGLDQLMVISMVPGKNSARMLGLPEQVDVLSLFEIAHAFEIKVKQKGGVHEIWKFRIKMLTVLANLGISVVINDLDAIWIKDPHVELFDKLPSNTDIMAQRASFPAIIGRTQKKVGIWGATLCMGFVYFRATNSTRSFFDAGKNAAMYDDQRWINYLLLKYKISWPENRNHTKVPAFDGPSTIGTVESLGLQVALLDPVQVVRFCPEKRDPRVVIEHCVHSGAGHAAGKKIDYFKKRGTWYINDDLLSEQVHSGNLAQSINCAKRSDAWIAILDRVVNKSYRFVTS